MYLTPSLRLGQPATGGRNGHERALSLLVKSAASFYSGARTSPATPHPGDEPGDVGTNACTAYATYVLGRCFNVDIIISTYLGMF